MKAGERSHAGVNSQPCGKRGRDHATENVAAAPPTEDPVPFTAIEPLADEPHNGWPAKALAEAIAE